MNRQWRNNSPYRIPNTNLRNSFIYPFFPLKSETSKNSFTLTRENLNFFTLHLPTVGNGNFTMISKLKGAKLQFGVCTRYTRYSF